jgi:hypothetical protein
MTNVILVPIEFTPAMKQALDVYYKRCEYAGAAPTDRGRYDAIIECVASAGDDPPSDVVLPDGC